jgi:two-component system phosphate regulon sensor histidine kinase PhoR
MRIGLSLKFSLLTAFICTFLFLLLSRLFHIQLSGNLVLFLLLCFALLVGGIWLFFQLYINKKLKDIFFTIHHFNVHEKEEVVKEVKLNDDFLEKTKFEVELWAQERRDETERLKKLEVYRKEYLGNVSHELKTPIFNIQGYVLTLLDGGLEDPSINRNYLQRAEKSVERMISIVEDLEAITQLESGELQLEIEKFDVINLIKEVIDAQELRAATRGIKLNSIYLDSRQQFVMADKFRVRQVLTNLIVNSIKYGKEGGETAVKCNDIGDSLLIEVADNGIGIPKQDSERVFERFYRVDKGRSRSQGGTGLGLAIVKHIIEAHGQSIQVISTEGAGSVFSFTLKKA